MDIPPWRHLSASSMLWVKQTIEWCAVILFRFFCVRLSGIICATCKVLSLLLFSSSISSLVMAVSSGMVRSTSFLGTPCITSPYLRLLVVTPVNTKFQSISLSSCGSFSDSQCSRYSFSGMLLIPWILGMWPSLNTSVIAFWHFCISSLACIALSWFLVASGAATALRTIVYLSRFCFLILLIFASGFSSVGGAGVFGGSFEGGSLAAAWAYVVFVGFASCFLISMRSFDICSIICCLSSSSAFSSVCVMVLASSRAVFAPPTSIKLAPEVLTFATLLIASLSNMSRFVKFGVSVSVCCGVVVSIGGESGITVSDLFLSVGGLGVSSMVGVALPWGGECLTGPIPWGGR